MPLDWDTFKSAFGESSHTFSYIDDEGIEIPIDSYYEFQEVLRLSSLNGNLLKLIIYDDRVKHCKTIFAHSGNPELILDLNKLCPEKMLDKSKNGKVRKEGPKKLNVVCQLQTNASQNQTAPPEWFSQYMKKFRKELVLELKSSIHDIICSAIEKELNLSYRKPASFSDLFCEKNETISSPVSGKSKKKKKASEKDSVHIIEQSRKVNVPKALEELRSAKPERLEKLDNKTKVLFEEKRKLLERKRHSKSKLDKNFSGASEKKILLKKSAAFRENSVFLGLAANSEFEVMVDVINDGKTPWVAPSLECFYSRGIIPKQATVSLPRLCPNENCLAYLTIKTPDTAGLYCLKYRFCDGLEKLDREFTCWVRVETAKSATELFYYDLEVLDGDISSSENKIEENIIEIEKRLHDIDLLQPVSSEPKKNQGKEKKKDKKVAGEFGSTKFLTDRMEKEAVQFGLDCWMFPDKNEECNTKTKKQKSEREKVKKDGESESNSDSELSVIYMCEEEYFIVESPSDTESGGEEKKSRSKKAKGTIATPTAPITPQESSPPKKTQSTKVETNTDSQEFPVKENLTQSPTRNRRSPLGEEISKPKKMKSKSTEYRFMTANLTQPTFTQVPDVPFEGKFTFTGEKETKTPQADEAFEGRPSRFTFTGEKEKKPKSEEDREKRDVLKIDSAGRVIYAVKTNGFCLPVKDLLESGENWKSPSKEATSTNPKREQANHTERQNDIPAVNILPNVLMNGASNVASLAFNTAKSVINNLQSAFVTEGKTEVGQPAYEDKKISIEKMLRLQEMGFSDLQVNRNLLLLHDNDLTKIVEELIGAAEDAFGK